MEGALSTQTPRKTTSTAKADMKNMLMLLANCAQQAGAGLQSGGGVDDRAADLEGVHRLDHRERKHAEHDHHQLHGAAQPGIGVAVVRRRLVDERRVGLAQDRDQNVGRDPAAS